MSIVLEHIGDGTLAPVKASQRQEIIAAYKVGDRMVAEVGKPRSRQQNKALHAAIAKAFMNVPEDAPRQFKDETELRHWCFLRVGFKDTILFRFTDGMTPQEVKRLTDSVTAIRRNYQDKGIYTEMYAGMEGVCLDIPKSWAFPRAKHKAATRVMDGVLDELVALVPGITREQLLTAAYKDAA